MNFLEKILQHHNLTRTHFEIIMSHSWHDDRFSDLYNANYGIFCLKCNIAFGYVLYKHNRADKTKWHELTCNEIIIKNILE